MKVCDLCGDAAVQHIDIPLSTTTLARRDVCDVCRTRLQYLRPAEEAAQDGSCRVCGVSGPRQMVPLLPNAWYLALCTSCAVKVRGGAYAPRPVPQLSPFEPNDALVAAPVFAIDARCSVPFSARVWTVVEAVAGVGIIALSVAACTAVAAGILLVFVMDILAALHG